MSKILMLKIILKALVAAMLIIAFVIVFLRYPLVTLSVLAVSWFILMLHLDPPAHWDN